MRAQLPNAGIESSASDVQGEADMYAVLCSLVQQCFDTSTLFIKTNLMQEQETGNRSQHFDCNGTCNDSLMGTVDW